MLLSVIIVNFNVKHFLEQCLCSVKTAIGNVDSEVIVVDNNSRDDSVQYLRQRFPWVRFICNKQNTGFAKANNQALALASGQFILFLNPDTLLPADCLSSCIHYLANDNAAGALGVKMIDGTGKFLPESKRAFPSPITSMFKLVGLASLFPASRLFGRYHLGHLPSNQNHEVDVLAGAFLMVKRQVIEKVGVFDETFFMYGEDIDLSYRIQDAGWKNMYFAETAIIHFKGESTKKGSLNYVRMFYRAMSIFVKKHYSSGKAGVFTAAIRLAIWARAAVSSLSRFLKWMGLPLADALITLGCILLTAWFWMKIVKPGIVYHADVMVVVIPMFTVAFIAAGGVAGLYDKWYRPKKALVAMIGAIIFNLAVYSLLDVDYRFSRGVILFGGILASFGILILRKLLVDAHLIVTENERREFRQTLIVGDGSDYAEVLRFMQHAGRNERILGRVGLAENEPHTVGSFGRLSSLLSMVPAREIVFCISRHFSLEQAMQFMQTEQRNIRYKFFYHGSDSMVGSDSKETSGEALSAMEKFAIALPESRRMKKITDIVWSIFLLVFYPLHLFFVKRPRGLLMNILQVLQAKKTWVGYCTGAENLPPLPAAVIGSNAQPVAGQQLGAESLYKMDYWYARDYEWLNDSRLIFKAYIFLGS